MPRPRSLRLPVALVACAVAVAACNDDGRTMRKPGPGNNASISVPSTTSTSEPPLIEAGDPTTSALPGEAVDELVVTAPWADGAPIPAKYTCAGDDVSPALTWPVAPEGTIEIAITMVDEDAPQYVHWAISGLEPGTTAVGEGVLPDSAIQAANGAGRPGYSGPCPPAGTTHSYTIEVHYLNQQLEVAEGEPGADMMLAIRSATFRSATVTGTAAAATTSSAPPSTTASS